MKKKPRWEEVLAQLVTNTAQYQKYIATILANMPQGSSPTNLEKDPKE